MISSAPHPSAAAAAAAVAAAAVAAAATGSLLEQDLALKQDLTAGHCVRLRRAARGGGGES